MKCKILGLVFLFFQTAALAESADTQLYNVLDYCRYGEKYDQKVLTCLREQYQQADNELNAQYQDVVGILKRAHPGDYDMPAADRLAWLVSAQRKWIAFRDDDCAFFIGTESAKEQQPDHYVCMIARTLTRTKQLEQMSDCDGRVCPMAKG